MQHDAAIPGAVLGATLADGKTVAAVVGDEVPSVRELSESTVQGFRNVWETRRDTDFPVLAKLGRIPRKTARRWSTRVTSLLAFVDEHRATGLRDIVFIAAKVSVLYSPAHDSAFVVDLGPLTVLHNPNAAADRAGAGVLVIREVVQCPPGR